MFFKPFHFSNLVNNKLPVETRTRPVQNSIEKINVSCHPQRRYNAMLKMNLQFTIHKSNCGSHDHFQFFFKSLYFSIVFFSIFSNFFQKCYLRKPEHMLNRATSVKYISQSKKSNLYLVNLSRKVELITLYLSPSHQFLVAQRTDLKL